MDDEVKTGVFQDKAQQVIQTTQDMYLGGIAKDVTFMTNDFNSVILNSLKGGSIRDLTFDNVYVSVFFSLDIVCLKRPQLP